MNKIYEGHLIECCEGGLHLDNDPIAEEIVCDIEEHGNYLTVRYWVSLKPIDSETIQQEWLKQLYTGIGDAEWGIAWSEITGYLWTDEEINVGGHDLLAELYTHEGKYLYMEIKYERGGG